MITSLSILACYYGAIDIVNRILDDNLIDPSTKRNNAIIEASRQGQIEVACLRPQRGLEVGAASRFNLINRLLKDKRVDSSDQNNEAIILASGNGHIDVVDILLSKRKFPLPRVKNNSGLRRNIGKAAAANSRNLYKLVYPSDQNNRAIILASSNGNIDVVKRLLEENRVNPQARTPSLRKRRVR